MKNNVGSTFRSKRPMDAGSSTTCRSHKICHDPLVLGHITKILRKCDVVKQAGVTFEIELTTCAGRGPSNN